MAPATAHPVQRIALYGRDWRDYQSFLALQDERRGLRVSFNSGWLEVMVASIQHEQPTAALTAIIELVAEETGIEFEPAGSPTIQRPELEKGFEPDASFYFRSLETVRDAQFEPTAVPAPDLIIEVDITSDSRGRFPIFAAVGVPEVWRYHEGWVEFLRLESGVYVRADRSQWLPLLTPAAVQRFLDDRTSMPRTKWLRSIRAWVREQRN